MFILTMHMTAASSFLLVWGWAAYFFSHKMVRLILLAAPIASVLAGIAAAQLLAWAVEQWSAEDEESTTGTASTMDGSNNSSSSSHPNESNNGTNTRKKPNRKPQRSGRSTTSSLRPQQRQKSSNNLLSVVDAHWEAFKSSKEGVLLQRLAAAIVIVAAYIVAHSFTAYCWRLSFDLSNPSIILQARLKDGRIVHVDDYREAYWYVRTLTIACCIAISSDLLVVAFVCLSLLRTGGFETTHPKMQGLWHGGIVRLLFLCFHF